MISTNQSAVSCGIPANESGPLWPKALPDHLHEVDEAVAVLPGVLAVTAQRTDVDVLREIQLVESLGEQLNCVVDKSRLRLDKKFCLKQI